MRIIRLVVTVSLFSSLLIGIMLASAVVTSVVHAHMSARPVAPSILSN
jgi:hypothetical protein